ncbi:hypothetical protein F5Y14DRAFT_438135 [Nemania sp. NC0429]|nr:hypothetical protein F5Y14DRAFT_438135 [Nemania sp. NC0429]
MAVYVVSGVSRGIGYAFLTNLSADPKNTVIGVVRDKAGTIKKTSEDATLKGRSNYHIVEGDLTNYDSLKNAAAEVHKITGGVVDYLIANAGYVSLYDTFDPLGYLGEHSPKELEEDFQKSFNINVIGNIHFINLFMPQVLKGTAKKVVVISTGFADLDFTNETEVFTAAGYSISKAASNMAVAKFSAQYRSQGVHFLSVCPGSVEVGMYNNCTPEQLGKLGPLMEKFMKYQPNFKGPVTPDQAVSDMRAVWESTSAEKDNGAFLSQFGNKQWL